VESATSKFNRPQNTLANERPFMTQVYGGPFDSYSKVYEPDFSTMSNSSTFKQRRFVFVRVEMDT